MICDISVDFEPPPIPSYVFINDPTNKKTPYLYLSFRITFCFSNIFMCFIFGGVLQGFSMLFCVFQVFSQFRKVLHFLFGFVSFRFFFSPRRANESRANERRARARERGDTGGYHASDAWVVGPIEQRRGARVRFVSLISISFIDCSFGLDFGISREE